MVARPIRVLIVDDDQGDSFITRRLLLRAGAGQYEVEMVATFSGGLDRLVDGGFDVAFIDFRLGNKSGVVFVQEARAAGVQSAMIIVTGQVDPRYAQQALEAGAVAYLDKCEFSPERLDAVVREAIGAP